MSCMHCGPRAEDCWDWVDEQGDYMPCLCACHDSPEYRRASGDSICSVCGKPYRKHPPGGPIGMDNKRFLRRLCNDELVKL